MPIIHHSSYVDENAYVDENVEIGAFCYVGSGVRIGARTKLVSHVTITGNTSIGEECMIYPFAAIGHPPQDIKHKGGAVFVEIGDRVILREQVTVHPGTDSGCAYTRIGNDCYLMVGVHVAHEVKIAHNVIVSNYTQLAGAVRVDEYVVLGGMVGVHQYTHIGKYAFVGVKSSVLGDVIPYGLVSNNPTHLNGLNFVGLKRHKFSRQTVQDLRLAYQLLFNDEGHFQNRLHELCEIYQDNSAVMDIANFINTPRRRALCLPNGRAK